MIRKIEKAYNQNLQEKWTNHAAHWMLVSFIVVCAVIIGMGFALMFSDLWRGL